MGKLSRDYFVNHLKITGAPSDEDLKKDIAELGSLLDKLVESLLITEAIRQDLEP